jgi:hypothetical protein
MGTERRERERALHKETDIAVYKKYVCGTGESIGQ